MAWPRPYATFTGAHALAVAVCHTGITELRRHDGVWQLLYVNRREHLPLPAHASVSPESRTTAAGGNGDEHSADLAAVARAYNRLVPTVADVKEPGTGTAAAPPAQILRNCDPI